MMEKISKIKYFVIPSHAQHQRNDVINRLAGDRNNQ